MNFLVTGGAGFIGSCFIRHLLETTSHNVLNIDKLTYAGSEESLTDFKSEPRYKFKKIDIQNKKQLEKTIAEYKPHRIVHLAAESHVDRSLVSPEDFINTNILGTFTLLQVAVAYSNDQGSRDFLFHHVSTDEVFGSLGKDGSFSETSPYDPRSPYSASKASSDHLVRAWGKTFGLPFVISNCSNNYGPYQFPEKLIPLMILNALDRKKLPIYGNGENVRDWLYVEDHARALHLIATQGRKGQSYNVGGCDERTNLEVVEIICEILQNRLPASGNFRYDHLISFVDDRPGHDYRYSIDSRKIRDELGWQPSENFRSGIEKTIDWYLENPSWGKKIQGSYDSDY